MYQILPSIQRILETLWSVRKPAQINQLSKLPWQLHHFSSANIPGRSKKQRGGGTHYFLDS